jgi:hypothetical protein
MRRFVEAHLAWLLLLAVVLIALAGIIRLADGFDVLGVVDLVLAGVMAIANIQIVRSRRRLGVDRERPPTGGS